MGGDDYRAVAALQQFIGEGRSLVAAPVVGLEMAHVRIAGDDHGPFSGQQVHHLQGRGLAIVVYIGFVGHPEKHHNRAVERLALAVEHAGDQIAHVTWHLGINLAGQFDETRVHIVGAGLPGEVVRVNRDAVTAQARPWRKLHEPVGLGGSSLNHLPDIEAHPVAQQGQFVDQRDVHCPKDVLEEFGHFGCIRR